METMRGSGDHELLDAALLVVGLALAILVLVWLRSSS
jgi:hypothetical protein